MSNVIEGESTRVDGLEFYVFSDGAGINEIRFSQDVQFVMSTLLGVVKFVADSMENTTAVKLLQDMTEVMKVMEAQEDVGSSKEGA